MVFSEQTKKAAERLARLLEERPWVFSVGVTEEHGNPVIVVYLRKRNSSDVPDSWEGLPVRTEYIGQVKPA